MTEGKELSTVEEKVAVVDSWVTEISNSGHVGEIEPLLLREILENFGANFEIGEGARRSLGEYTTEGKKDGMRAVWGETAVKTIQQLSRELVGEFEQTLNHPLPKLGTSKDESEEIFKKGMGMRAFLGDITAFAAGSMSFEDFRKYTEARALNGRLWQEGRKEERVKIEVPTADKPILLASFPPGFPQRAWSKIKEW